MCSPEENDSPGSFPKWVMLGVKPELSVAVGRDHVTWVDVAPLSAYFLIFDGQLKNSGPLMSV